LRRKEQIDRLARDCIYFKADRPCLPHLRDGALCRCSAYTPYSSKLLLIQVSSPRTVIRSSALVHRLKTDEPNTRITYLTAYPELLSDAVDEPLPLDPAALLRLQMDSFDVAYNLDLNRRACAVMNIINAQRKKGFYLRQGNPLPLDHAAEPMYLSALLPNNPHPQPLDPIQDLFMLCSLDYRREFPRLKIPKNNWQGPSWQGSTVGIYTGNVPCHNQPSPWDCQNWIQLIEMLNQNGIVTILLGDQHSDNLNHWLARHTPAEYFGPVTCIHSPPLPIDSNDTDRKFVQQGLHNYMALLGRLDVIVGAFSLTTELAWSLQRHLVLLDFKPSPSVVSCTFDAPYFNARCKVIAPDASPASQNSLDITPHSVYAAVLEQLGAASAYKTNGKSIPTPEPNLDTVTSVRDRVAHSRRHPRHL